MSGDGGPGTFKLSGVDVSDRTLKRIDTEINLAEILLLQYLKEISSNGDATSPLETTALENLKQLVIKELNYLKKVKNSEAVKVMGNLATFQGEDGEYLVTVVSEEDLQKNFHPFFCLTNMKSHFAKSPSNCDNLLQSCSNESIYYDALSELTVDPPAESSDFGRSIYGLLNYIFTSTIGKMDNTNSRQ